MVRSLVARRSPRSPPPAGSNRALSSCWRSGPRKTYPRRPVSPSWTIGATARRGCCFWRRCQDQTAARLVIPDHGPTLVEFHERAQNRGQTMHGQMMVDDEAAAPADTGLALGIETAKRFGMSDPYRGKVALAIAQDRQ